MRVFVAVWPPAAVVEQLARLERPPQPGVRWTTEHQWHVTVRFLGEIGPDDVERGKGALGRLPTLAALEPVTARAGPRLRRLGPSVLCLPVAGLDRLAADVGRVTAGIGAPVGGRPFRGHLTVARARGRAPLSGIDQPFAASWPVGEVTLVASTLHPAGARYQVISRVSLPA